MLRRMTYLTHAGLLLGLVCTVGCPFGVPTLSVSPTALSFDNGRLNARVAVANEGSGTLEWRIDSTPAWLSISPERGEIGLQTQQIAVGADLSGLAQGTHSGQIVIASNAGNRAVAVTALVSLGPLLEVSPTEPLDFGASELLQTLTIQNAGMGALSWSIEQPLPTGFALSSLSGTLNTDASEIITVTLDRSQLGLGSHSGTISIASNGGSQEVTVRARVQSLSVSPSTLDFGDRADTLSFTIRNEGEDSFDWTIDETVLPDWAAIPPGSLAGTLAGGAEQTIMVTVDRTGLGPEVVWGQVPVTSGGGDETVALRIKGEDPVLQVTPTELTLDIGAGAGSVTIENAGTGTMVWAIEEGTEADGGTPEDVPWLALDVSAGETPAGDSVTVTLTIDVDQLVPDPESEYQQAYLRVYSEDGDEVIVSVRQRAISPTLRATPLDLNFSTSATRKRLAIWNGGLGTMNWQIDTAGAPEWVSVSPVDPAGVASGSVTGEQTDAVTVTIDRTGLAPADTDYEWTFQISATDGGGNAVAGVSIGVRMNVARVPAINVDTGVGAGGVPNVDEDGIAFVPLGTTEETATFIVSNQGTGTLNWTVNAAALPRWVTSLVPAQASLEPLDRVTVTVTVSREGLSYGDQSTTLTIESNDPAQPELPVRLEMQVPKRVLINTRPGEIALGVSGISSEIEVANGGDDGSFLNFQVSSNKPWLYFYPETGQSEGVPLGVLLDWQEVGISIDRSQLDGTGATAVLTITAFELDEFGQRTTRTDVEPKTVTVSVEAAPLSFEAAYARTRIPSLVRFVMLMRDIGYRALPLPQDTISDFEDGFVIFEQDEAVEAIEASQFLAIESRLRTDLVILLDYSASMYDAAQSVADPAIAQAPDPLQALYNQGVAQLIAELPDHYNIALMEFHDRSQPTRLVTMPDGGSAFTKNKAALRQRLENIAIPEADHGATELLPALADAADVLAPELTPNYIRLPFDDPDVRALVCISDGRLTSPPGKIKDALDYLFARRVRLFAIGWGQGVRYEPLMRIGSGSGGHGYPTAMANTGEFDAQGNPIRIPVAAELADWCTTDDPVAFPCDQSVAKDLASQVVLSYVTLREDAPVKIRVEATFDDPNDDEGLCLPDQGTISGSFTQKQHDLLSISGDVRLGQISLRTDGIEGNSARVIVRAEYIPRNISELGLRISSAQQFRVSHVPWDEGGLIEDWDSTEPGVPTLAADFVLSSPGLGEPLRYGTFGDLLFLDFDAVALAPGEDTFVVTLEVTTPVYDAADDLGKYFCFPDTITVGADPFLAPAFPTFYLSDGVLNPAGTGIDFEIRNIGGSHVPTGVQLEYEVLSKPFFIGDIIPEGGTLASTTEVITVTAELLESLDPDDYEGYIIIEFDAGTLGTPTMLGYELIILAVPEP